MEDQTTPAPEPIAKATKHNISFVSGPMPQPAALTPAAVDPLFTQHFAKHWCMHEGYMPHFIGLDGDCLRFTLITDPRFRGPGWVACCNIATLYVRSFEALRGAKRFEVQEFRACDIIGYMLPSDSGDAVFAAMNERTKRARATLPEETNIRHFGVIRI